MTKDEMLLKCDEALAACLDKTKKKADGDEASHARIFAKAASTLVALRWRIATDDWKETKTC